jgi:hypothetical protein
MSFSENKNAIFLFVDSFPEKLVREKTFSCSSIAKEECKSVLGNATS